MTERKWTPGPWVVVADDVKEGSPEEGAFVPFGGCGCCGSPWMTADGDKGRAEARLIAAAPDLYEALCEALVYVPEHHGPIMHKINAALAKARGET